MMLAKDFSDGMIYDIALLYEKYLGWDLVQACVYLDNLLRRNSEKCFVVYDDDKLVFFMDFYICDKQVFHLLVDHCYNIPELDFSYGHILYVAFVYSSMSGFEVSKMLRGFISDLLKKYPGVKECYRAVLKDRERVSGIKLKKVGGEYGKK